MGCARWNVRGRRFLSWRAQAPSRPAMLFVRKRGVSLAQHLWAAGQGPSHGRLAEGCRTSGSISSRTQSMWCLGASRHRRGSISSPGPAMGYGPVATMASAFGDVGPEQRGKGDRELITGVGEGSGKITGETIIQRLQGLELRLSQRRLQCGPERFR